MSGISRLRPPSRDYGEPRRSEVGRLRSAERGFGVTGRRGEEVRTSNKYLVLCVFWAIVGERLHFGIRNSGFEEGKSNQAPNPSEVETVVSR